MELKIKIKEVKEEKRPLTIGETCMISVSREDIFSRSYRDKVQTELDCMGFVDYVEYDRTCGFFRTETIRDATPQERMAWMFLNMVGEDRCPNGSDIGCGPCIFETCISRPRPKQKAKSILSNKEVILELV